MDVDELDIDTSEAESLEEVVTTPIAAVGARPAAARPRDLPTPGFPRVTNLDEQALLFASDEESIIIGQLIALAKKEPVGPPPRPPPAAPGGEAHVRGAASSSGLPPDRPP